MRSSWYKARPFLATQPTRASLTLVTGCPRDGLTAFLRMVTGMRGGSTRTGVFHARRVHATDAGGGSPFRTSDPLLEPEDGSLHLRRAKPDPHHQPREEASDVRRRCAVHQGRDCGRGE